MGNRPEDKVKVIFVPCYLDGRDGIMNKEYYDILLGTGFECLCFLLRTVGIYSAGKCSFPCADNHYITLFADKTDKEVKEIRKRAAEVAEQALWKHFIQYYYEAYDIALCKAMKRQLS